MEEGEERAVLSSVARELVYFSKVWKEKNGAIMPADIIASCQQRMAKTSKILLPTARVASRNFLSVQVAVFSIIHHERNIGTGNQCPAFMGLLKICCV